MPQPSRIESAVSAVHHRLQAAAQSRSRLSRLSGVGESTLRKMQEPGWTSRTLKNLAAIEIALDALDAETAGDSPVADGIGAQAEATGEAGDIGAGEGACVAHAPRVAGTATPRDSIPAPEIDDQAGQQRGAK